MIAKKKYIIFGICIILAFVFAVPNIWSTHIKGDVVGFSFLKDDGETVQYFSTGTVVNTSFFPQRVTVEVYSYRDVKTSYIANAQLNVEAISLTSFTEEGDIVEEVLEGDSFEMEPLSSHSVTFICTGDYGGNGKVERHPADTIKLSSEVIH